MRERRLSERALAGAAASSVALDTSMRLEDMLGYLRELFNVRQGSVPIRSDYGLPDFNDMVHQFPDAIDVLRAEIARQIQMFEPRFRDITVRHAPAANRPLSLLFRVNARIAVAGAGAVTVETEILDPVPLVVAMAEAVHGSGPQADPPRIEKQAAPESPTWTSRTVYHRLLHVGLV